MTAAISVHMCAQPEPDFFGMDLAAGPDQAGISVPTLEFTGTLAHNAEVRTRVEGGQPVPVVCVDVIHIGPADHRMHVEQPFAPTERAMAESIAAGLRKGQRVAFTTLFSTLRTSVPAALSITHAEPQKGPQA